MKPWKSLSLISKWMLRIGFIAYIFFNYINTFLDFNFENINFIYAAVFLAAALLLLIGGVAKQSLTVIGGLILLIISVISLITDFKGIDQSFAIWLIFAGISMFFLSNGNK